MFNTQKTFQAKHHGPHLFPKSGPLAPRWFIVDAKGQVLGRLATTLSSVIRGKHKPTYTPHADTGDFVVVINADQVVLTGNKWNQKRYYEYSNYVGGLKEKTARELLEKEPEELIKKAVWRMMNRSSLARRQFSKLKVYAGESHPHEAQRPEPLKGGATRKTRQAG